jgi:starvation-inducible outer membrane lipoprotein
MKPILNVFFAFTLIGFAGCSSGSLFPPETTNDAATPEFGVLQAKTDVFSGRVVQLAGRIVRVEESASGVTILAQELPVVNHPTFGPKEPTEINKPASSFFISYQGKVDPKALWFGNKFIVVGVAEGQRTFAMDGIPRTKPYLVARCMHVWNTGGYGSYGIDDFPYTQDGYYPLEHQTYCAN